MQDEAKRQLRPTRVPKYRSLDDQDAENGSYSRVNYVKLSTPSFTQEYSSPALVHNQISKILVKFINKSNRSLATFKANMEVEKKDLDQKEKAQKNNKEKEEGIATKKTKKISKGNNAQNSKGSRELYKFKGQQYQNLNFSQKGIQKDLSKKSINGLTIQDLKNSNSMYSGLLSNQIQQLQKLSMNTKGKASKSSNLAKNQDSSDSKKLKIKETKINLNTQYQQKNKLLNSQKIFKRAAYHVAISYHIHLKKLKDQGIVSGDQLDPTFQARRLKQQQNSIQQ